MQDARRSVDYLVSRPDIDSTRLAYCGFSLGGRMASILLAVDNRFRTGIVYAGGLISSRRRAEVDPINYVSHVRVPILMLHGRYDQATPLESEARPMFELFGPPREHKRLHVVDTDHWIQRNELVRVSLAWLDRYLGPVAPAKTAAADRTR